MENSKATALYNEYLPKIVIFLTKKFGATFNSYELEILSHEALSKVILKYDDKYKNLNKKNSEKNWIFTTCINHVRDEFKKKSYKEQQTLTDIDDHINNAFYEMELDQKSESEIMFENVDRILSKYLKEDEKSKYYDFYMKGHSLKEAVKKYNYKSTTLFKNDLKTIENKILEIEEIKNGEIFF